MSEQRITRVGRFAIVIEGDPFRYLPVFANVFITTAQFDQEANTIYYIGVSPLFDELGPEDEGKTIPAYCFTIEEVDGAFQVKAVRIPEPEATAKEG